jgi:glycosyltransferase involved in cell wall biosynthesis
MPLSTNGCYYKIATCGRNEVSVTFSVIIPYLNQPDGLKSCLDSLDAQTLNRSEFEVIVVDNGSARLPNDLIKKHPGTRLLQEGIPGPGPARNRGVQAAVGENLAFIDADCRAHPDWLRFALDAIRSGEKNIILGGDVQIWRNDITKYTALEAFESVFAYLQKKYIEKQGFSGTGNLVVNRLNFDKVGPFGGIQVAEDMEWGRRARAAGFKFKYIPEMVVFHPARESIHDLFAKWDRHSQHYLNAIRDTPYWRVRWVARAIKVLLSPLVLWTKLVSTNRVTSVSAKLKAFAILVTLRIYCAGKMVSLLVSKRQVAWNRHETVQHVDLDLDYSN